MFQFDEAVEATTRISGAIVVINFNKPVTLAVERLNVNAPDFVSAARRDPVLFVVSLMDNQSRVKPHTLVAYIEVNGVVGPEYKVDIDSIHLRMLDRIEQ